MRVDDTFGFLLGSWSIERSIVDHQGNLEGRFVGVARVRPRAVNSSVPACPARASYRELGGLRVGEHSGASRRRLEYERAGDSTVLAYFGDGRLFVAYDLNSGSWATKHVCGEDHYELLAVVSSLDQYVERWWVRGPAKNYFAETLYRRRRPRADTDLPI